MTDDVTFWNRIAEKYASDPIADQASYERKLEETRALMPEGAEVFEFGCGTGSTALWHASHAGHIRATDISPEMIRIARGKAEAAGIENVTFEVGTVEDEPATPPRYDMVMAHSILHLVPDRAGAIRRAFSMLKPGGHFVTSTACLSDDLWFMAPILPVMRWIGKAPRVWFFSEETLKGEIRAAGFEIVTDWKPGPRKASFIVARKP